ncbi:MAG: hypothetical protein IT324_29270 [Anaerolineae bacterium]|nr:hypothetical protein [Anaerolineae bacterium]
MSEQTILYTTLPKGITVTGDALPVSVLVSPRLAGAPVLGDFPDFLNWTQNLKDYGLTLTFTCNGRTYRAMINPDPLQPELWQALFNEGTRVDSYTFDDYSDRLIISYPVRQALMAIKGMYQRASRDMVLPKGDSARQENANRYYLAGLMDGLQVNWNEDSRQRWRMVLKHQQDLRQRGGRNGQQQSYRLGGDGLPDASQMPTGEDARNFHQQLAVQFAMFHHMPPAPPITPPNMDEVLDFHKVISALGSYPELMRAMGLVFDIDLPVDFVAVTQTAAPGALGVSEGVPGWDWAVQPTPRPQSTTGYYHLFAPNEDVPGRYFFPAPQGGLDDQGILGLLNLNPDDYCLAQLDVDGALHKVTILAESIDKLAPPLHPEVFDTANTLPSIRSGGLSLISDDRAGEFLFGLRDSKTFNDFLESNQPLPRPFNAEDLLRGYRIDIWDSLTNEWHSLHRRNGTYQIGDVVYETTDEEGFTQLTATQPAPHSDPPTNDLYLHESIARWVGWSLSAPRPGKSLTRSGDPAKAVPPDDPNDLPPADRPNFPATPFPMTTRFKAARGSLPSLRFGRRYRIRVRAVDLAGNSVPLTDPLLEGLTRAFALPRDPEGFAYLRYEPVNAPVLVLREPEGVSSPGAALDRLVIRTFNSDPSLDSAAADITGSDRHIAPPRIAVEMAEHLGMFDDESGKLRTDAATYNLIAKRDDMNTSKFNEVTIPGQTSPIPLEPAEQLGRVPYLPDVMSRGAAIRDLPGTPSGAVGLAFADSSVLNYEPLNDANPRPGSVTLIDFNDTGDWRKVQPFRLALADGTHRPAWDADNRVLTVYLPKGTSGIVPLSSYVTPDDLKLMGVWQWLREYVEATTSDDPQQQWFAPGYEGADLIAHILQRTVEGGHWMITPPTLVTLVSAVQQPIGRPALLALSTHPRPKNLSSLQPLALWRYAGNVADKADMDMQSITAWRTPRSKDAYLVGALRVHGSSTVKVDLIGTWSDPIDDPSDPSIPPTRSDHSEHAEEIPLDELREGYLYARGKDYRAVGYYDPDQDLIGFVLKGDILGRTNDGRPIENDAVPRHRFSDTKHHRVSYTAVATSRFREYFPPTLDFTRSSDSVIVEVPASTRPDAPRVQYVIPTFGWERQTATNLKRSVRFGGGLRIYLERPWFSSGADELLGVVVRSDYGKADHEAWKPFVTQWGADPIWQSNSLSSFPTTDVFPDALLTETGLTLEQHTPLNSGGQPGQVAVVGYPVHFDETRNLWYADITINCGVYSPFVRLALARYQPYALADAKLSRVVLSDFVQLTPDRSAVVTADPYHPRHLRVAVSGLAPRGPVPTQISVTVQQRRADFPGDLGWEAVKPEVASVITEFAGVPATDLDLTLWSGMVKFAKTPPYDTFRLLIEEREFIAADYTVKDEQTGRQVAPGRLIYAEMIPLDRALIAPPDPAEWAMAESPDQRVGDAHP